MILRAALIFFVICGAILLPVFAQNQNPPQNNPPPTRDDDVVRVSTELVQTDVTVVDKKGRFVDHLSADQFELIIDGKSQPVSFFERVTSPPRRGTARDSAASSAGPSSSTTSATRRRTVLFFVDDLHLAPDSLVRARKALTDFINKGMLESDQVAVTSSSGQIGFLQQLTDNKVVLQAAVARLNYRGNSNLDTEKPPMSEYMALQIQQGDESAIRYYVAEIMKQNCFTVNGEQVCMVNPQSARQLVLQRARGMTIQSAPVTANTLEMLAGLMRTVAQLPGRKMMFLMSDGFYLNDRQTGSMERIKKITEAAGRAGVVIYTLDARGLITEALDATNNIPMDVEGLTRGATIGEVAASQDGLNALARDTGGLALRNTNRPMAEWLTDVLDDISNYYLLAWRPDNDEHKRGKFKDIKVVIKGRPDLSVRLRRGYFRTTALPMLTVKKKVEKETTARDDDMRLVIDNPIEHRELKTTLSLNLVQMPGIGSKVQATLEIDRNALAFDFLGGSETADVDIGAIFYDDKGKPKNSLVGRLRVLATNGSEMSEPAVYRFQAWLPPGLYQVRVGLRDTRSGKTGSAVQWIKVPAL
ncbi:MAG: VWA domain-containing protein [Pyrinomonadaceae bacterium]